MAHRNQSDAKFIASRLWRDHIRPAALRRDPVCVLCKERGVITPSTQVDHVKPPEGNWQLQRDPGNLRGVCTSCHSSKTEGALLGAFSYTLREAEYRQPPGFGK